MPTIGLYQKDFECGWVPMLSILWCCIVREYAGNAGEATGVTIDTEDDSFVAA